MMALYPDTCRIAPTDTERLYGSDKDDDGGTIQQCFTKDLWSNHVVVYIFTRLLLSGLLWRFIVANHWLYNHFPVGVVRNNKIRGPPHQSAFANSHKGLCMVRYRSKKGRRAYFKTNPQKIETAGGLNWVHLHT